MAAPRCAHVPPTFTEQERHYYGDAYRATLKPIEGATLCSAVREALPIVNLQCILGWCALLVPTGRVGAGVRRVLSVGSNFPVCTGVSTNWYAIRPGTTSGTAVLKALLRQGYQRAASSSPSAFHVASGAKIPARATALCLHGSFLPPGDGGVQQVHLWCLAGRPTMLSCLGPRNWDRVAISPAGVEVGYLLSRRGDMLAPNHACLIIHVNLPYSLLLAFMRWCFLYSGATRPR